MTKVYMSTISKLTCFFLTFIRWNVSNGIDPSNPKFQRLYKDEKYRAYLIEKDPSIEEADSLFEADMVGGASIKDQFTEFEQTVDDVTLICEAGVTLMRLQCKEDACDETDDTTTQSQCTGCKAYFCMIDFDLQKRHPETVPTFMDLVGHSKHCDSGMIMRDFNEIVNTCKEYDNANKSSGSGLPKILPLNGLITELGNTDFNLVTNAITSMRPQETRVIVEPQPLLEAMEICDNYSKMRAKKFKNTLGSSKCSREKAANLVGDVVYMLSRTRESQENQIVIKAHSQAVQGLDIFHKAFPNVNWMFIYDEPKAAIGAQMGRFRPERAGCVQTRKDPPQKLVQIVESIGRDVDNLSVEEYCAAYLAMLATAAVTQRYETHKGIFVSSENTLAILPSVLKEQFHIGVSAQKQSETLLEMGLKNSQGVVDPELQAKLRQSKLDRANTVLEAASHSLYGSVYHELDELAQKPPV